MYVQWFVFVFITLTTYVDAGRVVRTEKGSRRAKVKKPESAQDRLNSLKSKMSLATEPYQHHHRKYFRIPWSDLSSKGYSELQSDIGSLMMKCNSHANMIGLFLEVEKKHGRRKARVDMDMQINDSDWQLLRKLPSIIELVKEELKRAALPVESIRTAKRLLTAAKKQDYDALFSAEAAQRLHTFFTVIYSALNALPYDEFIANVKNKVKMAEALRILDELGEQDEEIIPDLFEMEKWFN